jgi:hypothetical protein
MAVLALGCPDGRPLPNALRFPHSSQHALGPSLHFARPREAHAAWTMPAQPDRAQGPLAPPPLLTRIATCATSDLFLQHPDKTLTTYV